MNPIIAVKSHIDGKNADLRVYEDRVEWELRRGISGGKIAAGIMTGGASLLVTGVKNGNAGTQTIPIRSISAVNTKRDGMLNSIVQFVVAGSSISARVSHSEAEAIRQFIVSRLS